jgi:3-hydroxyisobutyrate dehydrogenase-like beta-hydroxyacid dehydrogenase
MRIGRIGPEKLGLPMARKAWEAGFELELFDLVTPPERIIGGARVGQSVTEIARSSGVLLTSLPDDAAFGAVVAEAWPQTRIGSVLVDTSTVSLQACNETRNLSERIGCLAAPVSGGTDLAVRSELTLFCSGPKFARRNAEPVPAC